MKTLELKPHTIIMTIGPSNCGKSYFCEKFLNPFLESHKISFKYFSSDKIRQQLLGEEFHKHHPKMMSVSKQAFNLLDSGVDNYTQYPINTQVVIVDATHLSKIGRQNIINISKKNNYSLIGLVFNYKNENDYFKHVTDQLDKRVIFDMVKTLKNSTIKELEKTDFETIFTIDSLNFDTIPLSYEDKQNSFKMPSYERVCYIGDIHGCLDEFKQLLLDDKGIGEQDGLLFISDDSKYIRHVLVGDYIDKGPKIKETIEFLYANRTHFDIVRGNHEYWVYQYLNGHLKKSDETEKLIEQWFDTVKILEDDQALREKFFTLFHSSYDFIINDHAIITHAPCENKYLGKSDKISLKKQRNLRYPKLEDYENEEKYLNAKEEQFAFLLKDADYIYPFHLFGHTMLKEVYLNKNKVCLDTGCVVGGYLSSALWTKGRKKLFIKKYPSRQQKTEKLGTYFRTKDNEISLSSLEYDLQKRVKYAAKNKLNFISGTMSPCDKLDGDLESLIWGLNYYKSKGIEGVVLQPKYMGSRCQIRLHKTDVSKCMAFSRQGFEIKETRISSSKTMMQLFQECQKKYADVFEQLQAVEILFDGELLPWNAMGKDLIERDFITISKSLKSEIEFLRETGFDHLWNGLLDKSNAFVVDESIITTFNELKAECKLLNSETDKERLTEIAQKQKELEAPLRKIKDRESVLTVAKEIQSVDQMKLDVDKYEYQVNLFGSDAELEFRGFSILKTVDKNGKENNLISSFPSNRTIFSLLNPDAPYAIVNLLDDLTGIEQCEIHIGNEVIKKTIDEFWGYITKNKEMEGVVIKPNFVYKPDTAPYLKCRNKEYLRITYGQDYDSLDTKKEKLIRTKSIKRKIETSIKEWELGRKLLDIPSSEISIDNKKWIGLIVQLMNEQENEVKLDPRL